MPNLTDLLPHPPRAELADPPVQIPLTAAKAVLLGGVFGDPLLHLRIRHVRRSLLFDLGDAARLSARTCHQVTDVFVSHAHADHIGGFIWLLRSRLGVTEPCRIVGPPGLIGHVQGSVDGILWDRIGDRAPVFDVTELSEDVWRTARVVPGTGAPRPLGEAARSSNVVLEMPGFRVRAALLDHGTPVIAYAYEESLGLNVRKEKLGAMGLVPGPWLARLKEHVLAGATSDVVELPNGTRRDVATLAAELLLVTPGGKLVYATDLGDTPANRARLVALARGAHTLVCEATFLEADAEQARRTHHLTARACGEIATEADVARLLPFHFSRRYEEAPEVVYHEVRAHYSGVLVPTARA